MTKNTYIQRALDYLSHLSSSFQEELSNLAQNIEFSQQQMDASYQALEKSGDEFSMAQSAYKKALSDKEQLIKAYQESGKRYAHAYAIHQAILSQDERRLRSALSFIYTNRHQAQNNLARAALGVDQEIKQGIFHYYDILYQRALAVDEKDVSMAYTHWMEAKKKLMDHVFETIPHLKKQVQTKAILHKQFMKEYESSSLKNAQSHMLKNEMLKNSQQLEHLQLAFQ